MEWWADYSNGTLSAAALKRHGYSGVIRYVTAPELANPPGALQKHTTRAEFDEHRAAGLQQLLVYQGDTRDAELGYAGGVRNAQRAKAGADHLGYRGLIFFTNDRPELPNAHTWREYLDGAASVLGVARVGAYGFGNAMDAARGHAAAFWQAGRRSDVRRHVHFWQDNNHQPVVVDGGRRVVTDRNLVLKPITGGGGAAPSTGGAQRRYLQEESTMQLQPGKHGQYRSIPDGAKRVIVGCPHGQMSARIIWHGPGYPSTHDMDTRWPDFDWVAKDAVHNTIHRLRPWRVPIPEKATGFALYWDYPPVEGHYDDYTGEVSFEF